MTYTPKGMLKTKYTAVRTEWTRGNTSKPWTVYGPISVNGSYTSSYSKVDASNKGGRIRYPWGWWAPVRAYKRLGSTLILTGSHSIGGNGPSWETSTRVIEERNYPGWSGSTKLNATVIFKASHTSGALDDAGYPVLSSNMRSRLITECILKVGSRKANYGEAIAEGRKTISHIAKTASQLVRAILALRRGHFRDFIRALGIHTQRQGWRSKELSKRWLEYSYAWLPLMSDIYDTYGVIQAGGVSRKALTIRGVRQLSDSVEITRDLDGNGKLVGSGSIRYQCILHYRLTNTTLDTLYSLGLINPIEVAWAVVPFSFVVDWLIPVGNVLEAWSAIQGLTYIDGSISSKFSGSAEGSYGDTVIASHKLWASDFQVQQKGWSFKRESVSNPSPSLYIKSPFSTRHTLSALALIRSLTRG